MNSTGIFIVIILPATNTNSHLLTGVTFLLNLTVVHRELNKKFQPIKILNVRTLHEKI